MPKKDKKPPTIKCPGCGKPNRPGAVTCRYCGFKLLPSPQRPRTRSQPVPSPIPPPPQPPIPRTQPYYPPSYPQAAGMAGKQTKTDTKKVDAETELYKISKCTAWAHWITAIVLTITMVAAIRGAQIAWDDYQTARSEYEATTRPYLIIQNLEFRKASDNTTYLLIDITNFGDRPARNIRIEDISLCAVSPEGCTIVNWTSDTSQEDVIDVIQEDSIIYPGRVRTARIIIAEMIYQSISETDTLMVTLEYRYGNEEYWYKADLRLQEDNNTWRIEQEQGN